ncbi:MAG: LysR family transcriptional regulator [Hyphomicrobiales bacterium]
MDIRLLKFFVALYKDNNMTIAAERCFVSQPSISNGIKQLEDELGVQLFERIKKGVQPTEEGHHLYPIAIRILSEFDDLKEQFKPNKKSKYSFKLAIMLDLSVSRLSKFYENIRLLSDDVLLDLVDYNDTDCDARITLLDFKSQDELFLPLWTEDYLLCILKSHPLANYSEVNLEDLNNYNFIECPPCEAHKQTLSLLSCSKKYIVSSGTSHYKSGVLAMVKAGYGISFLPEGLIEGETDIISPPFNGSRMYRSIGMAYKGDKAEMPIIQKLIEYYQ